jgi:hypothetical protein
MGNIIETITQYLPHISIGGVVAMLIAKAVFPGLSGSIARALKGFLGWITTWDDRYAWTPDLHRAWDQGWGAIVGVIEQATTPEMLTAFLRILRGKPELVQERIEKQLRDHVSMPDFEKLVVSALPEDVREVWNEAKEAEAVKAIQSNAALAGEPIVPEKAAAIVRCLAPAARTLAAENPIPVPPPITRAQIERGLAAIGRSPERQAEIEEMRRRLQ